MTKHLPLLLFIGLAWGQSLKFVNTDGRSITFKKAPLQSRSGPYTSDTFYLNGTNYFLKNIDFKTKVVKVKKVYRNIISQLINYNKYEEIPFDSIRSFRYLKRRFSIIPMVIGGAIGYSFLTNPNANTLSFYFSMSAFALGINLSFTPKFSEELIVGDGGWTIKTE